MNKNVVMLALLILIMATCMAGGALWGYRFEQKEWTPEAIQNSLNAVMLPEEKKAIDTKYPGYTVKERKQKIVTDYLIAKGEKIDTITFVYN